MKIIDFIERKMLQTPIIYCCILILNVASKFKKTRQ